MQKQRYMRGKSLWYMDTPIGEICIMEDGMGISDLYFTKWDGRDGLGDPGRPVDVADFGGIEQETPLLREAVAQLRMYFQGIRKDFDLPLSLHGTPFQQVDWQALLSIPYGQTRSYRQIAEAIGRPRAFRAVGGANHNNPIGIIVPCHRVIGSDGALVGYGGGLPRKVYLLALEKDAR